MAPHTLVVDSAAALEPWVDRWDALAVAARRPYCAPGWMLAWWEHLRPARADLHVVLLADGERLLGVAPFYLHHGRGGRRDARVLAGGHSHRLDILAARGTQDATAAAVARALADARPSLVGFECFDARSPWPAAVRAAWPGRWRPAAQRSEGLAAPIITLHPDGHGAWLAAQSKNFRKKTGQDRRRLAGDGGRVELASGADARAAAIDAFVRLHEQRWRGRGGSQLPAAPTAAMLRDVSTRLPGDERLRLWTVRVGDELVAAQVFVAAGGEVANWNGGWDERYARFQPSLLMLLAAMEDASARGEHRIDMGGGDEHYKDRFADAGVDTGISSPTLLAPGARAPLTALELVPGRTRRALSRRVRRLPEPRRRQVLGAVHRLRGWARR